MFFVSLSKCSSCLTYVHLITFQPITFISVDNAKSNNKNNSSKTISRGHVTLSYSEGLSESVKNICKKYDIEVHFKSGKNIKDELVTPKDQDHLTKKSGIGQSQV